MASFQSTQSFYNPPMHQVGGYQSVGSEEGGLVTLLIRHLPEGIPYDTLSRLFTHYGASGVRPGTSGRLRNCAFVDFKNEVVASQAQRQLHGLRFLGKVLSVERAKKQDDNSVQAAGGESRKDGVLSQSLMKETMSVENSDSLKHGGLAVGEPIAPRLGIEYPFPPHLEYAYPPPDGNILTNIVNALIAVPRFYTQVLHLMNKMNIPAPFRMALPTPPLPPSIPAPPHPPPPLAVVEKPPADKSSDESEMESSDEEADRKSSGVQPNRKRVKRESIVGPAVDKDVAHESVGLKPATLVPKEKPMIKKKNPMLQIKITQKPVQVDQNNEHNTDIIEEAEKEIPGPAPKLFASAEDLETGKLPPEEILSLPMFKNYSAGNPAPVLYIKNLSKDVVSDDFYFIFGSIFGDLEISKSSLTVKLMQEGRMRGQAFVTFPSTELAHQALNLANGYVFKSKPMIIQFGRNPAAPRNS